MNIQTIRQKLEQKKGQAFQISKDLTVAKENAKLLEMEISFSTSAQAIISAVAKSTQEELSYRITAPVSLALEAVYPEDPYKMISKFEIAGRGTTECYLSFERNGNLINPLDASGGGPIDIASFALRISAWSLAQPRSQACLLLDEPFRFVRQNKISLAGEMLRALSNQLNLQIIMVSHTKELVSIGDKVIKVTIENGISTIEEIESLIDYQGNRGISTIAGIPCRVNNEGNLVCASRLICKD